MFQRWNWYLLIDLNWFITNIYWLIKFGDGMSEGGEIWSLEWLCTATPTSTDVITASSSSSFSYLLTTDSRSDWVMFDLKVSRLSAWTQLFFLDIGADLTEGQILLTAGWFIVFFVFHFCFKKFSGENIWACLDHDGEGDLRRLTVWNVIVVVNSQVAGQYSALMPFWIQYSDRYNHHTLHFTLNQYLHNLTLHMAGIIVNKTPRGPTFITSVATLISLILQYIFPN